MRHRRLALLLAATVAAPLAQAGAAPRRLAIVPKSMNNPYLDL